MLTCACVLTTRLRFAAYDPFQPIPVVVDYHGYSQNAEGKHAGPLSMYTAVHMTHSNLAMHIASFSMIKSCKGASVMAQ